MSESGMSGFIFCFSRWERTLTIVLCFSTVQVLVLEFAYFCVSKHEVLFGLLYLRAVVTDYSVPAGFGVFWSDFTPAFLK